MNDEARTMRVEQPKGACWYTADTYEVQESVCYAMSQAVQMMRLHIEWRMAQHELTAAQWKPLWMIKTGKARTPQELARELATDAGAVSRTLDRLEAKQLLRRTRSLSDRRVVDLELTDAGHAVVAHVPHVLAAVNNACLAGFSREEWSTLCSLLARVLCNAQALPGSLLDDVAPPSLVSTPSGKTSAAGRQQDNAEVTR